MNKIEALKQTIYNLENDVYEYQWIDTNSCNCGILAQSILNGARPYESGFHDIERLNKTFCPWSAKAYCLSTGIKLPLVFQALKDSGFTAQDIMELEYLNNAVICEKLNIRLFDSCDEGIKTTALRQDKPTVILYLKEWVKMLEEPTPVKIKEPEAKFVTYQKIVSHIPVNAN